MLQFETDFDQILSANPNTLTQREKKITTSRELSESTFLFESLDDNGKRLARMGIEQLRKKYFTKSERAALPLIEEFEPKKREGDYLGRVISLIGEVREVTDRLSSAKMPDSVKRKVLADPIWQHYITEFSEPM